MVLKSNTICLSLLFIIFFQREVIGQINTFENSIIVKKERKGLFRIRKTVNLIENNNLEVIYKTSTSIESLNKSLIKKVYTPEEIYLFNKKKFHYKSGYLFNINFGISTDHINSNISFSKRLKNQFEIGIGTGIYSNFFNIPTTAQPIFVTVETLPIYSLLKYNFNKGKRVICAKAKFGYANNLSSFNVEKINNSFLAEGKLGFSFSSRTRFKHYIEIGQSTINARGKLSPIDINSQPSIINFDIWFNSFTFGYGIEFGK